MVYLSVFNRSTFWKSEVVPSFKQVHIMKDFGDLIQHNKNSWPNIGQNLNEQNLNNNNNNNERNNNRNNNNQNNATEFGEDLNFDNLNEQNLNNNNNERNNNRNRNNNN